MDSLMCKNCVLRRAMQLQLQARAGKGVKLVGCVAAVLAANVLAAGCWVLLFCILPYSCWHPKLCTPHLRHAFCLVTKEYISAHLFSSESLVSPSCYNSV